MNRICNYKSILLFILKRIWHNWPNWGKNHQLNINAITLFWDNVSYYQLTNVFKLQKWMSCLWQQPKMDNYDETSRGEQSLGRHDIPWSDPLPPSSPALPAARHNPHSGTDRLTNKVNKYFPPLLKANQILILEVWSAEKKQQTIGRGELIELIHSHNALGWLGKKEAQGWWVGGGCCVRTVGTHFRLRMDKYLDISA